MIEFQAWPKIVPIIYDGPFGDVPNNPFSPDWLDAGHLNPWDFALESLRKCGSHASPGFMNPEGIVMYHKASNAMFKVTLEGDEAPKGLAA